VTRRFVLRPKTIGLRSTAVLFGGATIALIYRATHSPAKERVFDLVLAAIALVVVGLALTALVRKQARELLITDKAIVLANVAIRFDEVRILEEETIGTQVYLTIRSVSQRLAIAKADLEPAQYAEVVALVKERFNVRAGA
jgi:hypothetical protein